MGKRNREDCVADAERGGICVNDDAPLRLYVERWQSSVRPASDIPHAGTRCDVLRADHQLLTPSRAPGSRPPFLVTRALNRTPLNSSDASGATAFVYHGDMLLHRYEANKEVERPERAERTFGHLSATGLLSLCRQYESRQATTRDLSRVHTERHIDTVDQWGFAVEISGEQALRVGGDLYACKDTSRAARLAAGGVMQAAMAVCRGEAQNAFALVRPPGHHCTSANASGFCFFNNVAVAVRAAQHELLQQRRALHGEDAPRSAKPRILIVDWDVHHCDGTEEIFYDDPSVVVFSIHQYGSLPPHAVRRPHRPSPLTTKEEPAEQILQQDVTMEELEGLIDSNAATFGAETTGGAPVAAPDVASATLEPPAPPAAGLPAEAHNSTRAARRRITAVDFKALNDELAAADAVADDFFKNCGFLQDMAAEYENSDEEYASSDAGTRDSCYDSDSCSQGHGDQQPNKFLGDTSGTSSTAEEVDHDGLFYPGTGHMDRIGDVSGMDFDPRSAPHEHQPAAGRNVNFPWPTQGFGDAEYLMAMEEVLVPLAEEWKPEMIFVSCGFDCAEGDLLGSMRVTPSGFRLMTRLVLSLCQRVVVALEGGYNLTQVARGSEGVLRELLTASHKHDASFQLPPSAMLIDRVEHTVRAVKEMHAPYWKCFAHHRRQDANAVDPTTV